MINAENKEKLKQWLDESHANFVKQRDLARLQFDQLQGAVFACEYMLQKISKEELLEGVDDGKVNDQG